MHCMHEEVWMEFRALQTWFNNLIKPIFAIFSQTVRVEHTRPGAIESSSSGATFGRLRICVGQFLCLYRSIEKDNVIFFFLKFAVLFFRFDIPSNTKPFAIFSQTVRVEHTRPAQSKALVQAQLLAGSEYVWDNSCACTDRLKTTSHFFLFEIRCSIFSFWYSVRYKALSVQATFPRAISLLNDLKRF